METKFEPVLYIIMFEDVPDMNPGKGMAQACHAQAMMVTEYWDRAEFHMWAGQCCDDFGKTIVLSCEREYFYRCTEDPRISDNFGIVTDPSYPVRNYYGKVYTGEMETCAYVFAYTQEIKDAMSNFELHP